MANDRPVAAALVLNPRAWSLARVARPRATLEDAIACAGFTLVATAPDDATLAEQWQIALASCASVVFVAGGDGTLNAAAARLCGSERILAPVPGGTMNRFAARLCLPLDPLDAIAAHATSVVHAVPLASLNGAPFLHQCVVGRVSRLMRLRERIRDAGWRGWAALIRAVLRELGRRPTRRSLVARRPDGRRMRAHTAVVTAPDPRTSPVLTLGLAPHRMMAVRWRQAWRWFRGRLAEDPDILVRQGTCLAIASAAARVRVSLDGETHLAHTPLRFRLTPRALRLLAPP